jgi:hypothetical protein
MSLAFAKLLFDSLKGLPGSIIFYADECTPGNVLRPDAGFLLLVMVTGPPRKQVLVSKAFLGRVLA